MSNFNTGRISGSNITEFSCWFFCLWQIGTYRNFIQTLAELCWDNLHFCAQHFGQTKNKIICMYIHVHKYEHVDTVYVWISESNYCIVSQLMWRIKKMKRTESKWTLFTLWKNLGCNNEIRMRNHRCAGIFYDPESTILRPVSHDQSVCLSFCLMMI